MSLMSGSRFKENLRITFKSNCIYAGMRGAGIYTVFYLLCIRLN